jgi:glycosyltransferase involved in cell wall biosynthesis
METGLATYANRVLLNTVDLVDWTVAYPEGGDPSLLPGAIEGSVLIGRDGRLPIDLEMPPYRFYQLGNSTHCFPVLQLLYEIGGTAIFHELVLHHMLRFCHLETGDGDLEGYRRELLFEYGPSAEEIERRLSASAPADEYDRLLKQYPLIGRAVHHSDRIVCLNPFAASILRLRAGGRPVVEIGHPLSPLDRPEAPPEDRIPGSPLIGMLGGNRPGRNLSKLVAALERLRLGSYPDAGLALAGSGYSSEVMPGYVRVTGRLDEPEYQGWIREMDVVVDIRSPHCGETSGSLMEAMRAGIPAVLSAGGSFNHLPSDAVLRIPEEASGEGLAAALEFLLSRPRLMRIMGKRASEWAREIGSRERLRADWESLLYGTAPEESGRAYSSQTALAAAWADPPEGMRCALHGRAIAWEFRGTHSILLPEDSLAPVYLTLEGRGSLECGSDRIDLTEEPSVLELDSTSFVIDGEGLITQISWQVER